MFAPFCPVHGSRVLLFADNISEVSNTENGIEVHYECDCGYHGVWRTGAGRPADV